MTEILMCCEDLLSELADAGVLGVEFQRYQGCDEYAFVQIV